MIAGGRFPFYRLVHLWAKVFSKGIHLRARGGGFRWRPHFPGMRQYSGMPGPHSVFLLPFLPGAKGVVKFGTQYLSGAKPHVVRLGWV